jgi:hypothetical protein
MKAGGDGPECTHAQPVGLAPLDATLQNHPRLATERLEKA